MQAIPMKCFEQLLKSEKNRSKISLGFGMTEVLIALTAGTVIVGAGAVALRSTGSLIGQAKDKAVLRQNTNNGMRLLRSEVERSLHLIVNTTSEKAPSGTDFDINASKYSDLISHCKSVAPGKTFMTTFGIKMASTELEEPVLYGYGVNPQSGAYSLIRCGAPMDKTGKYIENKEGERNEFASVVVDNIGTKGCAMDKDGKHLEEICDVQSESDLDRKTEYDAIPTAEILARMAGEGSQSNGISFSDAVDSETGGLVTPTVMYRQPALRIQTDPTLKLVKFIHPNPEDVNVKYSYVQTSNTTSPLYLAAYARADKRYGKYGSQDSIETITIFQDITSKNVRFVLDGSGSMSACIIWSDEDGDDRKFWSPKYRRYIWTDQICLLTRMETLIQELHTMVNSLDDDTNLALEMFSASGGANHNNQWIPGEDLVRLGDQGNRDSALAWVVSLDDVSNVGRWGGTEPWPALNRAFKDKKADTVYLLSDGEPNNFYVQYGVNTSEKVVDHYTYLNDERAKDNKPKLKVNTIALGLESKWLRDFSESNNGNYMQYDSDALSEVDE
ncbi:VWA domain-containing protein [Synechococcus sp. AH-601-L23]|nr:VWA domain-containing protein [Synechococcus sp. AH-601-L23]